MLRAAGVASAILVATLATSAAGSARRQERCLHYEPAVVTLEGTLGRGGGAARGSAAEDPGFVLGLLRPICVAPDSSSADADRQPESGIRAVELAVGTDAVWTELKSLTGRQLRVTGELFHAPPGRRLAVLLWVIHAEASGPPPPGDAPHGGSGRD